VPKIVNDTMAVWDTTVFPGGYVCAALTASGEQCGEPVESEGCSEHSIILGHDLCRSDRLGPQTGQRVFSLPFSAFCEGGHRYGAPPWWPYCRRPGLC
jgi:hypothetical protein